MTNVGGKVERRETGKVKGEQLAVRGKRFCSQLTARWAETGGGNERFC